MIRGQDCPTGRMEAGQGLGAASQVVRELSYVAGKPEEQGATGQARSLE